MKTLLQLLLITIPFLLLGQNPTIHFDKTRCQNFTKTEVVDSLPYFYPLQQYLREVLPRRQIARQLYFSVWKIDGTIYSEIKQNQKDTTVLFPEVGNYFLQVQSQINPVFIELKISLESVHSNIYYNCIIHD